ncbi:hypothetical protein ACOSQ2_030122 [Xanthoceras sorbifolium]
MKILCWNVRGLGNPRTFRALRARVREDKPEMIFLSETRLNSFGAGNIRVHLGFDGCFVVDRVGTGGGLILLWQNSVDVTVRSFNCGHIDCIVSDADGRRWRFTGFYGEPKQWLREQSWVLLRRLAGLDNLPWLIGGDFNEILRGAEKEGGLARMGSAIDGFREAVDSCNLLDMGFSGNKFTWCNRQFGGNVIWERLDRCFCNIGWRTLFPGAVVVHRDFSGSDHRALVIENICKRTVSRWGPRGRGSRFHFEQAWADDPECRELIQKACGLGLGSNHMSTLQNSLMAVAVNLGDWNRKKKKASLAELRSLKDELEALYGRSQDRGVVDRIVSVEQQIDGIYDRLEKFWRQRSRAMWLKDGDRNTRFFHSKATQRRRRNKIVGLMGDDGRWRDKIEEIEREVVDFYSDLFTSGAEHPGSMEEVLSCVEGKVSEEMNMGLSRVFTGDEVLRALKHMDPLKAPGPDGLPVLFFQKFWVEVGPGVVRAVLSILNEGASFGSMGEALVVLIPKVKNPVRINEFRPISLCNVVYKLVAKVMANRLKVVLDKVISPQQSAFVPGRLISDNVLVGFECLHSLRGRRSGKVGQVALKLDMRKAYDRVEWNFLRQMMEKLGFSPGWIDKVMCCVTSASYSFLINGEPRGSVRPSRGLRQGCPLSPYLFLLCAEGLSAMLAQAEHRGSLHGIRVARSAPQVSHLLFADDSLVFVKAEEADCRCLKHVLDSYERASGQAVNYDKSALSFSPNTQLSVRTLVGSLFNIGEVSCHDKYLGLPSAISKNRRNVFANIKEKVWQKLQGWKHKLLSVGGREVLLKAVVQAVPTYAMNCFRLPSSLLKDIQRMIADFWWGWKGGSRKMHWVGWKHLCVPKERGGLGFRDVEAFNRAMLAKQGWRLLTSPTSLAAKVLKARYFPSSSFFDSTVGNHPSFIWRSILWGRDVLKLGTRWRVGNGSNILVYEDPWIPRPSLFKVFSPRVFPAGASVAGLLSVGGVWNEDLVRCSFLPEEAEIILSIQLSSVSCQDSLLWHYDKRGEFTVRSAYKLAAEAFGKNIGSSSAGPDPWWKALWSLHIPSKVKFFGWKVCKNILPTRGCLKSRKVLELDACPLCGACSESIDHILWSCVKVNVLWKGCPFFDGLNKLKVGVFVDRLSWVVSGLGKESAAIFLLAAWFLWSLRNQTIHGGKVLLSPCLWSRASAYFSDFQSATTSGLPISSTPKQLWSRPPDGVFKLNVDASVVSGLGCYGVGLIFRDDSGFPVLVKSQLCSGSISVEVAEARAVLEGVSLAVELAFFPLSIESDSLSVVQLCRGDWISRGDVGHVIGNILSLLNNRAAAFAFVPRCSNSIADFLAKEALRLRASFLWKDLFPNWFVIMAQADVFPAFV